MDEVVIRPVIAEDARAIAELWERLVDYHQALDPDLPPPTANGKRFYAQHLTQRLEDEHTQAYVAVSDGKIVGYVFGLLIDMVPELFEQEPSGFLADIFVDEAYRQQGVGRRLVEAQAEWFRQCGARYYEWHVAAQNPDAIAFWRSMGGREIMLRMRADIEERAE